MNGSDALEIGRDNEMRLAQLRAMIEKLESDKKDWQEAMARLVLLEELYLKHPEPVSDYKTLVSKIEDVIGSMPHDMSKEDIHEALHEVAARY